MKRPAIAALPRPPAPSGRTLPMRMTILLLGLTILTAEGQEERLAAADGMPQILVPAGSFTMGANDEDAHGRTAEYPPHTVHLDAFWIDCHEVTNAQFVAFLNAAAPGNLARLYEWCDLANSASRIDVDHDTGLCRVRRGYENHPACAVSRNGAAAYARHVRRRLPTEAEWERAARGTDARRYPWGQEWSPRRLITAEAGWHEAQAVGSQEGDRSPCGAWDMAGNVREWVEDVWQEDFYLRSPPQNPVARGPHYRGVTRGGAWCLTEWDARTTSRQPLPFNACRRYMGFRCAESVPPPLLPAVEVSPAVLFYAPMDGRLQAAAARGSRQPLEIHGEVRYVPGRRGQAAVFGESSQARSWVDYDAEGNVLLERGTIAFWMQPIGWNGRDRGFRFLFMLRDEDRAKFYIYRFLDDHLIVIAGNGIEGEWGTTRTPTAAWQDGQWIHIAVTWAERVVTLYVDGAQAGRATVSPERWFRSLPAFFSLGQAQNWSPKDAVAADTALDEVVIFSEALTPEQVQAEMSREGNP